MSPCSRMASSLALSVLPLILSAAPAPATHYAVVERVAGPSASWDYAIFDPAAQRVLLAQQGVTSLQLQGASAAENILKRPLTHGLALLADGNVAVDDSKSKQVIVFDAKSGTVLKTIDTAFVNPVDGFHALDALILEPTSGLLVAVNGDAGLLLLVDPNQGKVVGSVSVGGHPEFAAADGAGHIYINDETDKRAEIIEVDIGARTVMRRIGLPSCEEPTGLVFDGPAGLLISVCDNGLAEFVVAASGRQAANLKVGAGADAVIFDATRQLAFFPSGDEGTLTVVAIRGPHDIHKVQLLKTQKGTRLGTVDEKTGRLYLPAAKFGPPIPPSRYPSVLPGSFEFLVVAPTPP